MAKLINLSLNVDQIDESKLYKGKKGSILNLTIAVNDEDDQFGNNVNSWQQQTKEEREAKAKRNFLGNGKVLWSNEGDTVAAPQQPATQPQQDDLPF